MSYIVFALKWRPQNFSEVVGQDHIVDKLKNAIEKDQLAYAYLFAGPRGVGKTSMARIFAKALNCKDGPTTTPCQKCTSCIEISQGRSLDVIEIDGASNRGIDEIRTLRENVKFAPVSGKFKIYIIDEAHQITSEGFNALLKTLEEPPPFAKFILATTHPHKVIPTILSRCQRCDFRRIPVREIVAQLQKIIAQEGIEVESQALFAIANSSDGSLRDAEMLLDQLASFSKGKIVLKDVISILGIVEQEMLFEITERIIQKDAPRTLSLLNNIIDGGKDINVFLDNLIEHFRNLLIAKVSRADIQLINLPEEVCARLLRQAENFTLEELFNIFNVLARTQEISKRLDSRRIPLEICLVKLCSDKKDSGCKNNPGPQVEWKPTTKVTLDVKSELNCEVNSSVAPVSLEKIKEDWQKIVDALSQVKMSSANYFKEGEAIKLENNILTISFPRNYSLYKEALERKENKEILEKALLALFNVPLRVNFILSKE
ncbi:MAG: DNA polymerase III subunit gamma/tau, partial [Candidatus Omnitrophica bacterium]|nr:DNA polymerase III subunit gamma/tau [Candidatus Omnitrophota bacterium]